ncbi:MAG: hypothetical protein AAGA54_07275 [Myxococcota bacterium]
MLLLLVGSGCSDLAGHRPVLMVPDEEILPSMNAERVLEVPREDIQNGMWGLEQVQDEPVLEVRPGDVQKGMRRDWYEAS